jgi:hypothetical protein
VIRDLFGWLRSPTPTLIHEAERGAFEPAASAEDPALESLRREIAALSQHPVAAPRQSIFSERPSRPDTGL